MPQTILITGASGFVGTHITRTFLEKGYHVRATARSESSGQNLLLTHKGFEKQLTLAIVPDLVRPGAFDEAVNGVDGVSILLELIQNLTNSRSSTPHLLLYLMQPITKKIYTIQQSKGQLLY